MPLSGKWNKAFWGLAGLGALWACFLGSLTNPWLQRHALYAHNLHSAWWQDLDQPERWGFLKNQIRPFNLTTPDGETLYGYHVLPLDVYSKHEDQLLEEPEKLEKYTDSLAYEYITKDPESKVVVSFHGNAGHVGQGWRTDCYRAMSLGSQKLHVIAFDYRGFGYSTGSPTENGLITDGTAVVDWVLEGLKIQPNRVALVGQSLGTAVATAVAEQYALLKGIEFAGLVLISPFTDLVTLLQTYSIGRTIPILSPLAPYPRMQRWFESKVVDKWNTAKRLHSFVQSSDNARLYLIHAKDDFDIHWSHSSNLFDLAAQATSNEGFSLRHVQSAKKETPLGSEGSLYSWKTAKMDGTKRKIYYYLLRYGGHNRITTYPILPRVILELFNGST